MLSTLRHRMAVSDAPTPRHLRVTLGRQVGSQPLSAA